ncbi:hypothetical protein PHLGIDRAFT_126863 [Phlebiopsis gigantea 11061_1 CR5-6]|uniref:Fungal-type protein kinase domain-containing protein n=1 Tax=Phlebiopsis gigantea (strain 11061_1 CR5-6) TaxID=745531 RepID=A0A0C3S9W3_PHLG1|nr:hypothetical protein PHLGIDRAFT_126863 [Phlebiopsis gigantea 11061_1 CR5-6]
MKDPHHLFNFLYSLAYVGTANTSTVRQRQGYDISAQLAPVADIKHLKAYNPDNFYLRGYRDFMLNKGSQAAYPIYKVYCQALDWAEENEGQSTRRTTRAAAKNKLKAFLIGRPVTTQCSLTGRCTKGFVGFDLQEKRMCFIKDSWRPLAPRVHPEWEVYKRLKERGVSKFIATAIAGGDVPGDDGPQLTQTQEYLASVPQPVQRSHCRLVTREVGRSLGTYDNSAELLAVVYNALRAHRSAWELAEILHRDISVGNIMINVESSDKPEGFLNDWDLCKYAEDLRKPTTQPAGRSGTWPFMSALLLQYPKKPVELADDLESFVYVIVYMALRFHIHDMTDPGLHKDLNFDELAAINGGNENLATRVHGLFTENWACEGGYRGGGMTKIWIIKSDMLPLDLRKLGNQTSPLSLLMQRLYRLLHYHYLAIDYPQMAKYSTNPVEATVPVQLNNQDSELQVPLSQEDIGWNQDDDDVDLAGAEGIFAVPAGGQSKTQGDAQAPPKPTDPFISAVINPQPRAAAPMGRVLDNHDFIIKAFSLVFKTEDGQIRDIRPARGDRRFVDQFLGLQALIGLTPKRFSTKRKDPEEEDEEESLRLSKLPRTTSRLEYGQDISFARRVAEAMPSIPEVPEPKGQTEG